MIGKTASQRPHLSVVIVVVSDIKHLEGCLSALRQQVNPPVMEIIVPYNSRDYDIPSLKSRFPDVHFNRVDHFRSFVGHSRLRHEHLDELRAIGLALAQGEIVALLEDHDRPDQCWARNIIEAHEESYAAIGGAIENEVDRLLNWAIYFCDFGRYQNPLKPGLATRLSDVNISYKRQALSAIKKVWQDFYHEPFVNGSLMAQGQKLWLSPRIVVYQHRENLKLSAALRERYEWGRYYAGNRVKKLMLIKRLIYLALAPILPFLLAVRKTRDVLIKRRLIGVFVSAFPLTFLLTLFWSVGEFIGYLTASPTSFRERVKQRETPNIHAQIAS
jgi:hypothetical protein